MNLLKLWWNEPVIVTLEDIDVVLEPLDCSEENLDSEAEMERIRLWKVEETNQLLAQAQREIMQALLEAGGTRTSFLLSKVLIFLTEKPTSSGSGYLSKVAYQIRSNLQVHVRNVKISFHDRRQKVPTQHHVVVSIGNISAICANCDWDPGFDPKASSSVSFKVVEMEDFCLWVTENESLAGVEGEEFVEPMDMTIRMTLREPGTAEPAYSAEIIIDEMNFNMEHSSYRSIFKMQEEMTLYRLHALHWRWRPQQTILRGGAKAWFVYAVRCVLQKIREKRAAQRHLKEYVSLVSFVLRGAPHNANRLRWLETQLSVEHLLKGQQLAEKNVSAQEALAAAAVAEVLFFSRVSKVWKSNK